MPKEVRRCYNQAFFLIVVALQCYQITYVPCHKGGADSRTLRVFSNGLIVVKDRSFCNQGVKGLLEGD